MNTLKWMSDKEETKLLNLINRTSNFKAKRDYTICAIGFMTGLRLSEILGLNVDDVKDSDRLYVRPETAKRKKGRVVPLNPKIRKIIREWLKLKEKYNEPVEGQSPLFMSQKKQRLSRRSLQDMFEIWNKKAGFKKRYTVHSLRHSFAKRLVQKGVQLPVVQKLLGHASLASTGIYVEPGYDEMEEAVNARQ